LTLVNSFLFRRITFLESLLSLSNNLFCQSNLNGSIAGELFASNWGNEYRSQTRE
jgi:hypothetical protein